MAKHDEYSVIGHTMPRVDAKLKVTGQAKYAADIELPGMLWGKVKRSPYAHARILNIDTSRAESLPGVKAVTTGKDFGDKHRLRQKSLYAASPAYGKLIFLTELFNTQDSDDVLKVLVPLQHPLYLAGYLVVLFPDNIGVENTGGRCQRVNRRI